MALTIIVAALMLGVSFAFLATPSSAAPDDRGQDALPQGSGSARDGGVDTWDAGDWDWEAMADEEGLVSVIFSYTGTASATLWTAEADPDRAGLMARLESGKLHEFSNAFAGFSGRVSLEDIGQVLAAPDLGIVAYPDLMVTATLVDSVGQVGADQLWGMRDASNRYVTGTGMVVAVIDTGVDYTHPDLGGAMGPSYKVIGGYDFVNKDSDPMDDNGHGTHCAGIVAAAGVMTGVAPDARILAYKSLDASGQGLMSNVIAAMDRAMDPNQDGDLSDRADVISMSLGGQGDVTDLVCVAVENAVAAGIVVVVAAGNSGPSLGTVGAPGIAPEAVTVGAIDKSDALAQFSSRGTIPSLSMKPEISAPGVSIISTVPYGGTSMSSPTGYYSASGTSMATPHVAGGAALLLQLHPTWTPAQVKSALVTGAYDLDAALWEAGAGGMWLPEAAASELFVTPAMVSYGTAGDPAQTVSVYNPGSAVVVQTSSVDWSSLLANGSTAQPFWTNVSTSSPYSLTLPSSGTSSIELQVQVPPSQAPEGYYDGELRITSGTVGIDVPFGFAVLSRLSVTVTSMSGSEVKDPYGGVWVYRVPDCDVALGARGSMTKPVPPMTFLVPSGNYNVHSIGHQLVYDFSDPYALSAAVTVPRLSSLSVELSMASARSLTIDLETEAGNPIYVKDLRVYFRYEGLRNVSFHVTGSDYSIKGSEVFSIQTSKTIYVSDTDASMGISVSGFSYSAGMWDFMELNWDHWYEYVSGVDTAFLVEASADLQYLMAWEFQEVGPSTPTTLGLVEGQYSVYTTKYDIPGTIGETWCNWGTHRAQGGDAAFFVRRDTDTSLNPFFTGMTRTTVVQGVFSELYYPGNLFRGFIERSYYTPDYDHLLRANTAAEIYLPDRNFITPLAAESVIERIGVGPFYPALTTHNTNSSLVLMQPLLRDQSGAKVGGMSMPAMDLYRNGMVVGMYQLPEYLARPDALRVVNLASAGDYMVKIDYAPFPQISNDVQMTLGFTVPGTDIDPPRLLGMEMPQSFVPGSSVGLTLQAADDSSPVEATISWRPSSDSEWQALQVTPQGEGAFSTSIPTSVGDDAIHLLVRATDQTGNYLEFTMDNAALAQVPVVFELAPLSDEVAYRDSAVTVVLEGMLTDAGGNPLNSIAGVPLELMVAGEKVGMILDEYVSGATHTHNGDIRFQWMFNSADLFSSVGETVEVSVEFDLGIYERVSRTFTLTSVEDTAIAPVIVLNSPSNGALFAPGETIDLTISDDGSFTASVSIDGAPFSDLLSPWDILTSDWSDGAHIVEVRATDDEGAATQAAFQFDVDGSPPDIEILEPIDGAQVPIGFTVQASVSDEHLSSVTYAVDGGASEELAAPYSVDLTGWAIGAHTIQLVAQDALGHSASASVQFEIVDSTTVVAVADPAFGDVIRPGTPIDVHVYTTGEAECFWTEAEVRHELPRPYDIDTTDWAEGPHAIVVEASDDLGGASAVDFEVIIDGTPPTMTLVTPAPGSYVTPESFITVRATDTYLLTISWSVFGITATSESATSSISAAFVTVEGAFSVAVTAVDQAGNSVQETFVFVMDLKAPEVGIGEIEPGSSIVPDTTLTLTAQDTYISYFAWSLDGAPLSETQTPFEYSTEGLSSGWHQVTLTAEDYAGRTTEETIPFYIDDSPPSALLDDGYEVEAGDALVLTVVATDDFGIGKGTLYYESAEGRYLSVDMTVDGSELSATVDPDALWDGMSVYVVVEDKAGNTGESTTASVTITQSSGTPGGSDASDGTDPAGSPLPMSEFALSAVAAGAILLVLAFLTSRDKRRTPGRPRVRSHVRSSIAHQLRAVTAPSSARPTRAHPTSAPAEPFRADRSITRAGTHGPSTVEIQNMAVEDVRRAAAGPYVAPATAAQTDEYDDIERQLLSMVSGRSVYGDIELPNDTVIDDDHGDRRPTVVSGIGMSRKMKRALADDEDGL